MIAFSMGNFIRMVSAMAKELATVQALVPGFIILQVCAKREWEYTYVLLCKLWLDLKFSLCLSIIALKIDLFSTDVLRWVHCGTRRYPTLLFVKI